jgi:malate dehydrogenase (oxaloacetate-decarboxylating)
VAKKEITKVKVVVNGAGAAGLSISKLLLESGVQPVNLSVCDRKGLLYPGVEPGNKHMETMAQLTNPQGRKGSLADVLAGADAFIGVSAANIVTPEMVKTMAPGAVIFGMANPSPEIMPDLALAAGAMIVGTGRSDYPNQINNVLGFPGIFRGTLDVRASQINEAMKVAAAKAIANMVTEKELAVDYIIPKPFDRRVVPAVALAVAQAAIDTGVARTPKTEQELIDGFRKRGLI